MMLLDLLLLVVLHRWSKVYSHCYVQLGLSQHVPRFSALFTGSAEMSPLDFIVTAE